MDMGIKKLFFSGEFCSSTLTNIAILGLRMGCGLSLAFAHGIHKIPPPETFVMMVANLSFPQPYLFAWAASLSELLGGILLAVGLFSRFSSFSIACTMSVAVFLQHTNDMVHA